MTKEEVEIYIIERWRDEYAVSRIRFQLLMLGSIRSDQAILAIIKAYVDRADEAAELGQKKAPPKRGKFVAAEQGRRRLQAARSEN